ncbi:MAG: glycosyltransferase family 2 protein [Polymorphobacter sp.]
MTPAGTPSNAPVGVVLVNWNRWPDTIEALESLLRSDVPLRVIVVDNASADGSLDHVAAWAAAGQGVEAASAAMARFVTPPLPKPVAVRRIAAADWPGAVLGPDDRLVLVESGGNLGFAGGNNVGLRLLQTDPAIDCFWLLNNDTVVEADTAGALATHMAADPRIGMCGTVVRYYWHPDRVQALNGYRFSYWTGGARGINGRQPVTAPYDAAKVAADTDFVLGASLAVSRAFLETVGPMEGGYFLYYEEIDWAVRNKGRFRIGFAEKAVVYHKEGGSIGSSGVPGARSNLADYWLTRSRLAFIRRHRPLLLPWHWIFTLGLVARRLARRQPDKARTLLRALLGR